MVYFQIKTPNLGTFWRALEWKMLLYFKNHLEYSKAICYNLWTFGIVCVAIWYIFGIFT
jgi:hypothetical protein